MEVRKMLDILSLAERLKDATRHCYTSGGRRESVAEHCWMAALMAYFLSDEFPEADMGKVIKMCLIHDLGEAFTGDIPCFEKTKAHEQEENEKLKRWVDALPEPYRSEMLTLYAEMEEKESLEAKIYKAIDNMEAVIQHNRSDLSTWLPLEYELNQVYGEGNVAFSEYMKELRRVTREDTVRKLREGNVWIEKTTD